MNPGYPTFAFLAFVLVLVPLPWHVHAWNAGTCIYMAWAALGSLIHFINSIVWAGNVDIHSMAYCDIVTKILVGWSVGIPCAALCITRRLYLIATVSSVYTTKAEKRRAVFIDVAIGVGIPVIVMALHYVVQGHRFDIYEDYGCWPHTVNMLPSYFLVWIWPIVIGIISLVYGSLSLSAFFRRRVEFNQYLSANQSMVSANRYFRLMALATINIVVVVPMAVYFMYLNIAIGLQKWVSWSDTKWHFDRVDTYPAWQIDLIPLLRTTINMNVWTMPTCGILFFIFFGLAEEARRHYKYAFQRIIGFFGIKASTR
ncbi:fungal pheromone STE3G-protein-coupled receptor [Hysterangium stoloniferum]|nr:fungal pheromone STE3G-protein-coupled receptor [Hysterangium stoloniferum]